MEIHGKCSNIYTLTDWNIKPIIRSGTNNKIINGKRVNNFFDKRNAVLLFAARLFRWGVNRTVEKNPIFLSVDTRKLMFYNLVQMNDKMKEM